MSSRGILALSLLCLALNSHLAFAAQDDDIDADELLKQLSMLEKELMDDSAASETSTSGSYDSTPEDNSGSRGSGGGGGGFYAGEGADDEDDSDSDPVPQRQKRDKRYFQKCTDLARKSIETVNPLLKDEKKRGAHKQKVLKNLKKAVAQCPEFMPMRFFAAEIAGEVYKEAVIGAEFLTDGIAQYEEGDKTWGAVVVDVDFNTISKDQKTMNSIHQKVFGGRNIAFLDLAAPGVLVGFDKPRPVKEIHQLDEAMQKKNMLPKKYSKAGVKCMENVIRVVAANHLEAAKQYDKALKLIEDAMKREPNPQGLKTFAGRLKRKARRARKADL